MNVLAALLLLPGIVASPSDSLEARVAAALEFAHTQVLRNVAGMGDSTLFPRSTLPDGAWKTVGPEDWTSGFFPGILWNMYEWSGDGELRAAAERWTARLESQKNNAGTHDVGFMMMSSFGNGLRLWSKPLYRDVLLDAANTLATRYHRRVGSIKSWDGQPAWPFPVIIDNMMNLELLFWASKNGGPESLRDLAITHALTTLRTHVRPDGSTFHVVDFDTATGEPRTRTTAQGAAAASTWARGQAWAVYGFTMTYRETGDPRFLSAARKTADFFLKHLPPDGVPYWDFTAAGTPTALRDASAGAIAVSGLFELSGWVSGRAGERYAKAARRILSALLSPAYLAAGTRSHGLLNHGVGNLPGGSELDVSLIYGDYYLVEAMLRFLNGTPAARATGTWVTVTNPSQVARTPETVEVSWQALREANPAVQPWPLAVYEGRTRLPAQSVDLDGDGTIDQLLFQVQVRPHEVRKFVVRNTYGGSPISPLTDARFVLPREDIGWESDRIAFRMYGPALASEVGNGFDVWTKRVHYPIVEKWYRANEGRTGGKDTYHEDRGEGADFFAVGRTLGAGSCALLDSGRLALPGVFSSYRIISPGPLRAIFRVTYLRGTFRGVPFREDKTVSIDAGSNLNRVEVVYSGIEGKEPLPLVLGVVKRKGVQTRAGNGWVALWGPTTDDPVNGELGTGVVVPPGVETRSREDSVHLMLEARVVPGKPFIYWTGAGWSRTGEFPSVVPWEQCLVRMREQAASPLEISVGSLARTSAKGRRP